MQLFDRTRSRLVIGKAAAGFLKNIRDNCWIFEGREAPLQPWSEIAQDSLDVRGKWPAGVVDEIGFREMVHAFATPAPLRCHDDGKRPALASIRLENR